MAKDMAELQEALNRSQSFISSITKAVDPNKLSVSTGSNALRILLLLHWRLSVCESVAVTLIAIYGSCYVDTIEQCFGL
jgi:hypothetical protein